MEIWQCCNILNVNSDASDEAIASAYRRLALKFHPDRNRENPEQAHRAMTNLNAAYSELMSWRFQNINPENKAKADAPVPKTPAEQEREEEALLRAFIKLREAAKEELYRFFQYGLYNLARREGGANPQIFARIVKRLRISYHGIDALEKRTKDGDLLEHFSVFKKMIFDFYRASECLNVNNSYRDMYETEAYRSYKKGDEALASAAKELFYDRHNRGFLKGETAAAGVIDAEIFFKRTLLHFSRSSWTVETKIKLEFAESLKKYMQLFFSD